MLGASDFDIALRKSLKNIHDFSERFLRFRPTWQQAELFDLIQWETFAPVDRTKKGIFVKSGQGPGKTGASTVCVLFRLLQEVNNKCLVTAPTMAQVGDTWLGEVAKWVGRSDPELQRRLDIQKRRIKVRGFPNWEVQTATAVKPENMQGRHHANLTVMVDEASGIERKIWETLKGTITEPGNLLIGIGNPNDRDTEFFDAFNKDKHLYHLLTWNAEESPNVDPKHIKRMAEEYGVDSDVYRVRVKGEFPLESPNVVIRYEDLLHACRDVDFNKCMQIHAPHEDSMRKQFGIDLARFGGDESVAVARVNSSMLDMRTYTKWEPADVIHDVFQWQRDMNWSKSTTAFCVDAGGMGQGVLDHFYGTDRYVHEFHSHGRPIDPRKFNDKITEAYWQLRVMSRDRQMHLKEDATAFQQLVSRQYRYQKGLFRLESKDEYLKRVGTDEFTSPDRADAIALAFYPHAYGSMTVAA